MQLGNAKLFHREEKSSGKQMVGHDRFIYCLYLPISDNYRIFPFQNFVLLLLIEQKNGRQPFPPYFALGPERTPFRPYL
jgi:hypothetical protein